MGFRIGQGIDLHRLVPGRPCVLGGVEIPSPEGPEGHSDGDVVLHALADALLGTAAAGDLGSVFGTDDPVWRGAASSGLVRAAFERAGRPSVLNVDVTVLGLRPKVGPHRDAMRRAIGELLGIPVDRISVKASTGNGLTGMGRGEGVGASVVLLVEAGS